jgi:uncharacterized protein YecT (DUF1311 family)
MIEKISLILLGVAISGLGYLLKRYIEKKSISEVLGRQKMLLEINKQMRDQNLSPEELIQLEAVLVGKTRARSKRFIELEKEILSVVEKQEGEYLTQKEMNIRASTNLDIAEAKMRQAVEELSMKLEETEKKAMLESQYAWKKYSEMQAEAASSRYREGSIYPLIYLSELESLVVERTARLRAELDELKSLSN